MSTDLRSAPRRLTFGAVGALVVGGVLAVGSALAGPMLSAQAAVGTGTGVGVGTVQSIAVAEPTNDLTQEHLAAIGEAGTVYLSGTWSGFVNFPLPDGTTAWSDEIDTSFSCSGFVASSDGYVVTAGHCADVAEGKTALIDQFLSDEVANGDITAADADAYIAAGAEGAWPVEGQKTGEPPVLTMKVYPAITISNDTASGYSAVLQDDRPLGQGDVALFKIDAPAPLPVLVVSSEQPATGSTVDAIGYPGNVTDLVSGNPQPTFSQGQVSGRQQTDGGPFTQIGVTMSPGMSGGPVIDGVGDVVGTISFGPSGDTQQLNFAAAPETITALLARNGVKNVLGDADTRFRVGLAEYFDGKYHRAAEDLAAAVAANPDNAIAQQYQAKATEAFPRENTTAWVLPVVIGGVVLLLLVAGLVLLLVLRAGARRRRAAAAAAAGSAAAGLDPASAPVAAAPAATLPPAATPPPATPSVPATPSASATPSAPDAAALSATDPAAVTAAPAATHPRPAAEPASAPPSAPAAATHCSNCGAAATADQRFCTACGQAVAAQHPTAEHPTAPSSAAQHPAAANPDATA